MGLDQVENAVGVFTLDVSLAIQVWDAEMERFTGISAAAARGKSLVELFPDLEARGRSASLRRVLREGVVQVLAPAFHHYLIPCALRSESKRFDKMQQRVTIAPLNENERTVGIVVTIEDVTARLDRERHLADQLRASDESTRLQAAKILAENDGLEPAKPLLGALKDESWHVRRVAVGGVARRAAPDAIAALLDSVREDHLNLGLLNSALQVLALSDVDTLSPLLEFLAEPSSNLRMQAALALGEQGDTRAIPSLLSALGDPDLNVRYHVIEALGKLKAVEATETLASIAEERDFFLSFAALEALMQIGDVRVTPRMVPLLEHELLREPAAALLGKLGDEAAVAPLAELLNKPGSPSATIAHALATLYDRYDKQYGEGEHIADLSRAHIRAAGAQSLLDTLNDPAAESLHSLALVLGWLEGPAVERALTHLLGQPEVRNEVVEALVLHGARVSALLIEQLDAEDLEVRRAAIVALGRIGDARAVPALLRVLDQDSELIIPAADSLAKIGDGKAFEALLRLVGSEDAAVRQAVVGALNSLGVAEMPARIMPLLRDPDPNVRESAVRIAGYFGYPECAELLIERCHDEHERVRGAAVEHLSFLDDGRVCEELLRAMRHDTPKVRAAAAKALAHVDGDMALSCLMEALTDHDSWVRYFAVRSLDQHRAAQAIEALVLLAQTDKFDHVRIAATDALGNVGGERAVMVATELVKHENVELARAALSALAKLRGPGSLSVIIESSRSVNADLRLSAVNALTEHGGPEVVEDLKRLAAADPEPVIVRRAIAGLAKVATADAIAGLVALVGEPERRDVAIAALAQTGDESIESVAGGLSDPNPDVRRGIVDALTRMKRQRASEFLTLALQDSDTSVWLAATRALGADPEFRKDGNESRGTVRK